MECAICFEDLTEETGHTKLGRCGHTFHLRCIAQWFYSQEVSSCPCCRREVAPCEDVPISEDFPEEDEDEDDEEDDISVSESDVGLPQQLPPLEPRVHPPQRISVRWIPTHRNGHWVRAWIVYGHSVAFPIEDIHVRGANANEKCKNIEAALDGIRHFQALWRGYSARHASLP